MTSKFITTAIVITFFASAAQAGDVASAKSYGYVNNDAAKYNRLVGKYAKKDCKWLAKENKKAIKTAGKEAKGTGIQIGAGILNNGGTTKLGLATQITGDVIKDAAIRRDASEAVYTAKGC